MKHSSFFPSSNEARDYLYIVPASLRLSILSSSSAIAVQQGNSRSVKFRADQASLKLEGERLTQSDKRVALIFYGRYPALCEFKEAAISRGGG